MLTNSRANGLERLRGLALDAEAGAAELDNYRPRFDRLAGVESAPRVVSGFNLFQTPPAIALRMVDLLGELQGRILEPSAGLGRLYQAIRQRSTSPVVLVDSSPECCDELHRAAEGDRFAEVVSGDFLGLSSGDLGGEFDAILMNPPFQRGADVKHIRHALGMLRPGGRLVALCADGLRQRAELKPLAESWHELPANSFACEGTRVAVAMAAFER